MAREKIGVMPRQVEVALIFLKYNNSDPETLNIAHEVVSEWIGDNTLRKNQILAELATDRSASQGRRTNTVTPASF